ncbi:MAG: zinc ribbon domain-containing protein [Alphaproteobacteria bacterium]|nr:zinc ribbon domain-containing protein [Alphaproteobacteria bacterium]
MKKFFCFYCQEEVEPKQILRWRFCPHCKRPMSDEGEGFYIVCDNCGANMPPLAENCLKCGHGFRGASDISVVKRAWDRTYLLEWLAKIGLFIVGVILCIGFIHFMFYLLLAVALLSAVFFFYDLFFDKNKY